MSFLRIIQALRLPEITVKTGFILIGSAFALPRIAPEHLPALLELFLVALLSGLAIYAINAFFGYVPDQHNKRLNSLTVISKKAFGVIAIMTVFPVLIWMLFKSISLLLVTLGVFILWTAYVFPGINLKGRVFGGVAVAFIAQVLHFRIGVLYVGGAITDQLWISMYFALIFASGHIWHELIDWDADKKAGVRTTAIFLGKYKSIWLAEFFFVLATLLWFFLGIYDVMPVEMIAPFVLAYILQKLVFYALGIQKNQSTGQILQFRKCYLVIFFIATVVAIWSRLDIQAFLTLIM